MSRPPAVPTPWAPRHAARVLAALAAVALAAPAARAQSATLTFDGLTAVDNSGQRLVANCYEEGGFRVRLLTAACGDAAAFGTWTADNPDYYTGSPALYGNMAGAVEFADLLGRSFSFQSIGLAAFLGQLGVPTTVVFTGLLAGGGTVTQTVEVPGGVFGTPVALTPFSASGFGNITALRVAVTDPAFEPFVQMDNVTFAPAVVPEPATVALFGVGLAGLGAAARRRARTR